MESCSYLERYSLASAGTITPTLTMQSIVDNPSTPWVETAIQLVEGTFSFYVTDYDAQNAASYHLGDQLITGSFRVSGGFCSADFGCDIK